MNKHQKWVLHSPVWRNWFKLVTQKSTLLTRNFVPENKEDCGKVERNWFRPRTVSMIQGAMFHSNPTEEGKLHKILTLSISVHLMILTSISIIKALNSDATRDYLLLLLCVELKSWYKDFRFVENRE